MTAIQYGWDKFTKKPAALLVPVLVVVVVMIVLEVIVQIILQASLLGTHDCTRSAFGVDYTSQCGPSFFVTLIGAGLAGVVVSFIGQLLGAGLIKSALNVVDGGEASLNDVFAYATKPAVVTAAAIVAVATFIGTILCYLPGLIIGYLLMFTMFFVVDKDMAPMEAVRASFAFTTSHLGETILFALLGAVVMFVGAILCGVGILVAIPVVLAGAAYTFRVLHDEPVSPAAG